MDKYTIFTKTAKGLSETLGKTKVLSRESRKILKEVDGQATLGDIFEKLDDISEAKIEAALGKMLADDFIRQFASAAPAAPAASMGDSVFGITTPAPLENAQSQLTIGDFIRAMEGTSGKNEGAGSLSFKTLVQESTAEAEHKAHAEEVLRKAQTAREQIEAEHKAQAEAEAKRQREAEEQARKQAEMQARIAAQEKARHEAEEKARRDAEQARQQQAEEKALQEAAAAVMRQEAEEARRQTEQQVRQQAEGLARQEAAAVARHKAEAEAKARQEAEEKARREAEEKTRREAQERARKEAEVHARQEEEQARQEAAAEIRRQAEAAAAAAAKAKQEAEQQAQRQAEEEARRKAEELAIQAAQERARQLAEEQARQEAAEQARREAEAQTKREAEEQARQEAEAQAIAAAQARALELAEEQARQEAAEQARHEAEEQARREAEEQARRDAELKREAEARAKKEAEEQARQKAWEAVRVAAEAQAKREAEAQAKREAEEHAKREAEEQARLKAEEKARQEAEEKARREAEAQAKREAAERAKREAEEQARLKAEEKARKAAEEKARKEAEAQAKKEAKERARQEAEEQARLKAEEKARKEAEEKARRVAEEKAREEAREQARKEAEENARIAAEEKARRDAEAEVQQAAAEQAKKEAQERAHLEQEEQARLKAEEDASKEVEKQAKQAEKEAAFASGERVRISPLKLLALGAAALAALLVAGIGALHFISFNGKLPELEKTASAHFGHPVKVKNIRFSLFPKPTWQLENVLIGDAAQIGVHRLDAAADMGSLFGGEIGFKSITLQSPIVSAEGLGWLLFGRVGQDGFGIRQVTATYAGIKSQQISLPAFDLQADIGEDGNWQKIVLDATKEKLHIELRPKGNAVQVEMNAESFIPPFGTTQTLEKFNAKGSATRAELSITEFQGIILGGVVSGNARLSWESGWNLNGSLEARQISPAQLAPALMQGGTLELGMKYTLQAAEADKLFASARSRGNFSVSNGSVAGIDLAGTLLGQGSGSKSSSFSSLTGEYAVADGKLQLRRVQLGAGLLSASGNADVESNGDLSGRFAIDLKTATRQARGNLNLSGTVKEPQISR